ncbi:uncharacterized protein G2W53_007608 [Senna tora]|uniref:Uncharacterized protein n=1 Tax=Senna tora TaxID=362788 RepID=A0A835CDU5_9FABA|nr:uncharacterized protein G2W53_007608 [Senna tora]
MGLVIAWKEREVMFKHILNLKSRLNLKRIEEVQVKHVVARAKPIYSYLVIRVDLMLEWE